MLLVRGIKAKVLIFLLNWLLNYKKMNEELPRVVEAAKSMIILMESLGSSASVQKMMPYENW